MGMPLALFLDSYQDDVKKLKLSIMNYVKALQTKQSQLALPFGIGNE